MRVIEPHKRKEAHQAKEQHEKGTRLAIAIALVLLGGMFYAGYRSINQTETASEPAPAISQASAEQPKKGVLKTYTGQQFRELYEKFAYPNTQRIDENSPITGNVAADAHIKQLAAARGYIIRSAPVADTFVAVAPNMSLQEKASQPWVDLQNKAKEAGQILKITAAYRSAADQRTIFLNRLSAQGVVNDQIATGRYDSQINRVLASTAPPGYSRHHSGYTVDIACENDPYSTFDKSLCFEWLSADNYKNAKIFGWIPSYPIGTDKQGPEPEAWEYAWVGKDTLTE